MACSPAVAKACVTTRPVAFALSPDAFDGFQSHPAESQLTLLPSSNDHA
jgi:hypothetical protein